MLGLLLLLRLVPQVAFNVAAGHADDGVLFRETSVGQYGVVELALLARLIGRYRAEAVPLIRFAFLTSQFKLRPDILKESPNSKSDECIY